MKQKAQQQKSIMQLIRFVDVLNYLIYRQI